MVNEVSITLKVFFDESFWVGIFEFKHQGIFFASRVVFGAEPKEMEIYDLILKQFHTLKYSPAIIFEKKRETSNYKRKQRSLRKEIKIHGVGTKSQQALKLQRELIMNTKHTHQQELKKHDKEKKFALKQLKKKAKHKGR